MIRSNYHKQQLIDICTYIQTYIHTYEDLKVTINEKILKKNYLLRQNKA